MIAHIHIEVKVYMEGQGRDLGKPLLRALGGRLFSLRTDMPRSFTPLPGSTALRGPFHNFYASSATHPQLSMFGKSKSRVSKTFCVKLSGRMCHDDQG
jgi:hypothetical protein